MSNTLVDSNFNIFVNKILRNIYIIEYLCIFFILYDQSVCFTYPSYYLKINIKINFKI